MSGPLVRSSYRAGRLYRQASPPGTSPPRPPADGPAPPAIVPRAHEGHGTSSDP